MGLIAERVKLADEGKNPKVIGRVKSGWVVLGDDQRIPGYCLLLASPVVDSINALSNSNRTQFLLDMTVVGDALKVALGVQTINYSILGNTDHELHVHIHPRYLDELDELRKMPPWFYHFTGKKLREITAGEVEVIREKVASELKKMT